LYRSTTIDSTLRLILSTALASSLGACAARGDDDDPGDQEEANEIASALETENGGLTMDDEAPQFGDEDGFAAAQLEAEKDYDDPIADDPTVTDMLAGEATAIYHAAVLWGQMPPDFDAETVVDWSGTLTLNRGAMLIRRVVAFEDRTDSVERRTDPASIAFASKTRPHMDGFHLILIDPTPDAADPMVLTYAPADGAATSWTIDALASGPQSVEVDDVGNRLVAVAMREPADACENGFLRGRWHRVRDGRGRLYGHVTDADGELLGHMRGLYGVRRDGEQVFFGKFIDRTGRFRGLFAGTYGDGDFQGRWIKRGDPDLGVLGGEYRESRLVRGVGGHFLGRWAETSCDASLE
jgi:hypothetical protein